MNNFAQKNLRYSANPDCTVHYYNNPALKNNDISFHWWQSGATSLHMHDFYEFFIITDNRTLHEINGIREELKKGTLYMIRPTDVHKFILEKDHSCVHMNICVTEKHLKKICGALKLNLKTVCEKFPRKVNLTPEELEFFVSRARTLNPLMRTNSSRANTLICELIAEALTLINRVQSESMNSPPQWFTALLETIHSPENLSLTAKDIYALGGFSPPSMIQFFKIYTGMTPNAYLKAYKCESACHLLRSTNLTVLEISNILGYDSLSYFGNVFKEFSGMTPIAYRKANGGSDGSSE